MHVPNGMYRMQDISRVDRGGGQADKLPPLSKDGTFLETSDNVGNVFFIQFKVELRTKIELLLKKFRALRAH